MNIPTTAAETPTASLVLPSLAPGFSKNHRLFQSLLQDTEAKGSVICQTALRDTFLGPQFDPDDQELLEQQVQCHRESLI